MFVSERKIRTLFIILAAVMMCFVFAGCGRDGDSAPKVVFTSGLNKDEVFRVDDVTCTRPEMMLYLTTAQNRYEAVFGSRIWDMSIDGVTLEESVKENVLEKLAQIKTMYLLARSKGVELDEDEEVLVTRAAEEFVAGLSAGERELLNVTKDSVAKSYREYALAHKVYDYIIQDVNPEISDDEARTVAVQYIFLRTYVTDSAGNKVDYLPEQDAAVYDKLAEIRRKAVDEGVDFTELAARYSDDSTISASFGKEEWDFEVEQEAFNLETGQISQVVKGENGYYLLKCISTFDPEDTQKNKLQIVEKRRKEVFGREYETFMETLTKRLNSRLFDSITFIRSDEVTTTNFFEVYERFFPEG